jgi:Glycosyl hydrolases family 39
MNSTHRHDNRPRHTRQIVRQTPWALRLCVGVAACLLGASTAAAGSAATTTVTVDWTKTTGRINRALFSLEGLPKVYQVAKDNPTLMPSYLLLNPQETMTRMETWIHLMEPQNDNDDPDVYNWDKLYPENMVRFVEDRKDYEAMLDRLGTERLSLLCYNVDWNKSENEDDPVADKDEWAEFAAAVVTDYNGTDPSVAPRLRYVEIWNEPNMPMFYGGTRESYFELFNTTARRLHREHPEVMVGGPALTPAYWAEPEQWYDDFIEACGAQADFVIHHIYHAQGARTPADLAQELVDKTDKFRALPGKGDGKISITETDAWFSGWPKVQYMLGRHFRFLEIQDRILSIHHFTTLAYNEQGNHAFGLMDNQGAPLMGTYWPYWLFRNVIGDQTYLTIRGEGESELDAVATRHVNDRGATLQSFVIHNPSDRPINADVRLYFNATDADRVLTIDRVTESFQGVEKALLVPAGDGFRSIGLALGPGEAVAIHLRKPGSRHFAFSDLNNQVYPFMMVQSDKEQIELGDTLTLTVRVLNTTAEPVSGDIQIKGLADGWPVEVIQGETAVKDLAFGASQRVVVRVKVDSKPEHQARMTYTERSEMRHLGYGISPYAVLNTIQSSVDVSLDDTAHSIPTAIILKVKDD